MAQRSRLARTTRYEVRSEQDVTETFLTAIHLGHASAESLQTAIPRRPPEAESLPIAIHRRQDAGRSVRIATHPERDAFRRAKDAVLRLPITNRSGSNAPSGV